MYIKNSTNIIRIAVDNKFRQVYDEIFKILFITIVFTFLIASFVDSL